MYPLSYIKNWLTCLDIHCKIEWFYLRNLDNCFTLPVFLSYTLITVAKQAEIFKV